MPATIAGDTLSAASGTASGPASAYLLVTLSFYLLFIVETARVPSVAAVDSGYAASGKRLSSSPRVVREQGASSLWESGQKLLRNEGQH
jgi:hypothetical protein